MYKAMDRNIINNLSLFFRKRADKIKKVINIPGGRRIYVIIFFKINVILNTSMPTGYRLP
jgi:hypothetical protein